MSIGACAQSSSNAESSGEKASAHRLEALFRGWMAGNRLSADLAEWMAGGSGLCRGEWTLRILREPLASQEALSRLCEWESAECALQNQEGAVPERERAPSEDEKWMSSSRIAAIGKMISFQMARSEQSSDWRDCSENLLRVALQMEAREQGVAEPTGAWLKKTIDRGLARAAKPLSRRARDLPKATELELWISLGASPNQPMEAAASSKIPGLTPVEACLEHPACWPCVILLLKAGGEIPARSRENARKMMAGILADPMRGIEQAGAGAVVSIMAACGDDFESFRSKEGLRLDMFAIRAMWNNPSAQKVAALCSKGLALSQGCSEAAVELSTAYLRRQRSRGASSINCLEALEAVAAACQNVAFSGAWLKLARAAQECSGRWGGGDPVAWGAGIARLGQRFGWAPSSMASMAEEWPALSSDPTMAALIEAAEIAESSLGRPPGAQRKRPTL